MTNEHKNFYKRAAEVAADKVHREKIKFNISRYESAVEKGQKIYKNLELARERAGHTKYKVINNLEKYLIEFEDNFVNNGGKVIWAETAQEAVNAIIKIAKDRNVKHVVKSKSMTTEELELNKYLENNKIESLETDLGEFIVQQAGQRPYHIVTPAMHMSKYDIADLYHEKFGTDEKLTPEELTLYTRKLLRKKFADADMGITGANFLIADTGAIALTENEGNGILSMSFPKVHIAIAGIEKIIPSLDDLDLYWPLLATHGTGQHVTVYNSIISGPKKRNEKDGPEEMFVILLDNGRSKILAEEEPRRALSCIRCGACLNACPIYKNIGGHAYNTTYSGPIGSIITPYMTDFKQFKHLSFACTICGKCTEVCPVKIPLHDLMLLTRNESVKKGYYTFFDKASMKISSMALEKRKMLDMVNGNLKNKIVGLAAKKVWGEERELPKFAEKSFSKQWKEKYNDKK